MKILAIGNSFSCDALRYFYEVGKNQGIETEDYNMAIGGCSLERHAKNVKENIADYWFSYHGDKIGKEGMTLDEIVKKYKFDYITLQQVSQLAPKFESYLPFLDEIVAYLKKEQPQAKFVIHQTWAYEEDSQRLNEELGYKHHQDMFSDIEKSYCLAKEHIGAEGIIQSGKLFEIMLKNGMPKVHRDTYHASLGAGRYALALNWLKYFYDVDITKNTFCDFDEPVTEEEIKIIKDSIMELYQ